MADRKATKRQTKQKEIKTTINYFTNCLPKALRSKATAPEKYS
jgi:hypothetical protein